MRNVCRRRRGCLLIALLFGFAGSSFAEEARPRYETRDEHDPNGIGKFYLGREIAQVMGHQGAGWLDRPEREVEEAPSKLIKALDLKPGMVVADVGCGTGVLSFPLAERVRPSGSVLAVDVQPEMLAILEQRAKKKDVHNIVAIEGTETDPKLPVGGVDLILMVDVYHEFAYPYEMMTALVRSLKSNGRIVFVEYRREDPEVPIKLVHKMSEAQVLKEMSLFPMRHKGTLGILPRQHIIVFERMENKK